LVNVNIEEEK
jgi:ribosome assembly protein 4